MEILCLVYSVIGNGTGICVYILSLMREIAIQIQFKMVNEIPANQIRKPELNSVIHCLKTWHFGKRFY